VIGGARHYDKSAGVGTIVAMMLPYTAFVIGDGLVRIGTAFMTPVSSPVNTLVVTPGNYTFGNFVRVGVPFSLIVMVVCVILVPWLLPLY
jgi:di/tricarboxylate transporter